MVRLRSGKKTNLAWETETQPRSSALIRLPLELKWMIYEYALTPTTPSWEYDSEAQCKGQPVREHIKQLHILVSVCRHMRYEVIAKYFTDVQAHLLYAVGSDPSPSLMACSPDIRPFAAMREIKSSPLFRDNLQHVRLAWFPTSSWRYWPVWYGMLATGTPVYTMQQAKSFIDDFGVGIALFGTKPSKRTDVLRQPKTFQWLRSLKNLKTLEIIVVDPFEPTEVSPRDPLREPLYNTPDWDKFTQLPKLEMVSIRAWSTRQKKWKRMHEGEQMDEALKRLLKDPEAGLKARRPPRIRIHLGEIGPAESSN